MHIAVRNSINYVLFFEELKPVVFNYVFTIVVGDSEAYFWKKIGIWREILDSGGI